MSPPARDGATEWSGCSLGCGIMPWSYSSACESDETVRINSDAERVGACSTSHEGGHSREPRGFVSTLRKLNTNWRSMSNRKESYHRHGRPPPAHTFTPYPPIYLADLSRPLARQPSRPGLPIPQLFAPRRRHTCTGAALLRAQVPVSPTPPASTAVLPSCSSSV